jgi:uncharacterized membrane protein
MEPIVIILFLVFMAILLAAVVLPIVALVVSINTKNRLNQISKPGQTPPATGQSPQLPIAEANRLAAWVQQLDARVASLETTLIGQAIPRPQVAEPRPAIEPPPSIPPPPTSVASPVVAPVSAFTSTPVRPPQSERIESIIGRRWLGRAAVCVILFAAAFFLKYAFDNRWIGELGRVAIGVAFGISMTVAGFKYHQRNWRVFSQILTAGGIVLLYLCTYAAFGYYHLATQKPAFVYLAILVAEAAGLALLYDAPAIAIMALIGGFLSPILLRSDRDQYRSLFGYIAALDLGALALLKHWPGLGSLAFAGTHLLFWLWYGDRYHPQKLGAVMAFQTIVFLLFLLAHLARELLKRGTATVEDLVLTVINPFVYFATAYHLLNSGYHDWMGVFALVMALVYAATTKVLLKPAAHNRVESLLMIGVALTFVTIAIPIQLRSNWITIAWSVEALLMLWAGLETRSEGLRAAALALFGLALLKLVFWDTPHGIRPMFTPVLNKYFLSALVVTACLLAAASVYQKVGQRKQIFEPIQILVIVLVAIGTLWLVMSLETYSFFAARAAAKRLFEDAHHERWLGQMALSVLWSIYAGVLAAIGFIRHSAAVRWAALSLFALTVVKAMLVDIAQLQQLYRVISFLVLGFLLLLVAWGYQKAFHAGQSSELSK